MKLLVGVTGTFGSGKTTVAGFFKHLGAEVVDADKIVHRLYEKNEAIKKKIKIAFGEDILVKGRIERRRLAERAFSSKERLKVLCRIVYPEAVRAIKKAARASKKRVVVLDAPMLIEAGLKNYVDFMVIVKATRENQIKRCAALGFSKHEITKRVSFQMPLRGKLRFADFVVDNSYSKKYTERKVKKIWEIIRRKKNG